MSYGRNSVPNRESQVKFAQTRVSTVEKFYGFICDTLGSVIRKSARLRDKGDIFALHVKEYADAEQLNNTTKISLLHFAENFSAVQDFRNTEIQRLEARVLKPLVKYGDLCKNMKSNIRGNLSAWEREKKQIKQLEKVQVKQSSNSPQVVPKVIDKERKKESVIIAQSDLEKASKETSIYGEQLISDIDLFERSKLADMKTILKEFVQIEMLFHSKALEYLSNCFEAVQHIDTEADMDQFRNALLEASGLARSFTQTGSSSYTTGTGYSSTLGGGTISSSNFSSSQHDPPRLRPRTAMYNDADDEDSEEYESDSQ